MFMIIGNVAFQGFGQVGILKIKFIITFDPDFDSFPMFSHDGKKIAFSSNRNNGGTRETNLFVADWVD